MTDLRTAAQQALEFIRAMNSHGWLLADYESDMERTVAGLEAALAQEQAEPTLQTCNCRWDGDVQVQQCTLHEAHVDAIHEWAERAKTAEKKLAALTQERAEPVQENKAQDFNEPVAWLTPGQDLHLNNPEGFRFSDWTPLYTAPPKADPLTEEEIDRITDQQWGAANGQRVLYAAFRTYARAVERAHGIGGGNG